MPLITEAPEQITIKGNLQYKISNIRFSCPRRRQSGKGPSCGRALKRRLSLKPHHRNLDGPADFMSALQSTWIAKTHFSHPFGEHRRVVIKRGPLLKLPVSCSYAGSHTVVVRVVPDLCHSESHLSRFFLFSRRTCAA